MDPENILYQAYLAVTETNIEIEDFNQLLEEDTVGIIETVYNFSDEVNSIIEGIDRKSVV